jgi:hypothetical protein
MEKLVQSSAEENGVWQIMVAASVIHQRQEHDLDKLRMENNMLKQKIDGHYATSALSHLARIVLLASVKLRTHHDKTTQTKLQRIFGRALPANVVPFDFEILCDP